MITSSTTSHALLPSPSNQLTKRIFQKKLAHNYTNGFDYHTMRLMNKFIIANASLLLCILSVPNILARSSRSSGGDLENNNTQIKAIKSDRNLASVTFTTDSPFRIFTTSEAKESCNLHETAKERLDAQGFTKILCPFGVLILGDSDYPDDGLKYGANIIANILDNNNDGIVDDADVLSQLAQKKQLGHGAVLMCGSTEAKEQKEDFFDDIFSYSFSCQTYESFAIESEFKAIMFEETFHLIHQNGWAVSYPDTFGLDSYTSSVVCRETARHQCTSPGYVHPENICPNGSMLAPGSPQASPLQGTCNDPDCDCVEFYRQAATAYMNWVGDLDFWYADHMPENKADFMMMVSSELLSVMENPVYNQPQAPLSGVYTYTGMTGTNLVPSSASDISNVLAVMIPTALFLCWIHL